MMMMVVVVVLMMVMLVMLVVMRMMTMTVLLPDTGHSECTECEAGFYNAADGSAQCFRCG